MPEPLGSARAILSQLIYWVCSLPPWMKILPASAKQYPVTMLPRELSSYQDGLLDSQKSLPAYFYLHSNIISSGLCNSHCVFSTVPVCFHYKNARSNFLGKKQSQGPFLHIDPSWTHFISVITLSDNAGEAGDASLILESGRYPGEENSNPLQYSCLENSMNRGAWQTTVHRMAKSQTQLSKHAGITLLMSPNVSLKHNFLSAIFRRWKKFNLSQNMMPCKLCGQNSLPKDSDAGKDWGQEEKGAWDGWMASPTQWTWVWANSGR